MAEISNIIYIKIKNSLNKSYIIINIVLFFTKAAPDIRGILDPEVKVRYQIYIPEVHYRYEEQYNTYKDETDKMQSKYASLFP